jgi:hypothetical protein
MSDVQTENDEQACRGDKDAGSRTGDPGMSAERKRTMALYMSQKNAARKISGLARHAAEH